MEKIYKKKVCEDFEINRFKTLIKADKTFKVLTRGKPLNRYHDQLQTTPPQNRKPLNCNFDFALV